MSFFYFRTEKTYALYRHLDIITDPRGERTELSHKFNIPFFLIDSDWNWKNVEFLQEVSDLNSKECTDCLQLKARDKVSSPTLVLGGSNA